MVRPATSQCTALVYCAITQHTMCSTVVHHHHSRSSLADANFEDGALLRGDRTRHSSRPGPLHSAEVHGTRVPMKVLVLDMPLGGFRRTSSVQRSP